MDGVNNGVAVETNHTGPIAPNRFWRLLAKYKREGLLAGVMAIGFLTGCSMLSLSKDGRRLRHDFGFSEAGLLIVCLAGCSGILGVVWAAQSCVLYLERKEKKEQSEVVKFFSYAELVKFGCRTVMVVAYLFLSTYISSYLVKDRGSYYAMIVLSWAFFASVLVSGLPEDFGTTDCFIAANLGIAIKFGDTDGTDSSYEPSLKAMNMMAIAVLPVVAKYGAAQFVESWIRWTKAKGNANISEEAMQPIQTVAPGDTPPTPQGNTPPTPECNTPPSPQGNTPPTPQGNTPLTQILS